MPKRVLGVRVPKRVRRGPVGEVLGSEIGQELVEDAIAVLAGLLVIQVAKDDSALRRRLRRSRVRPDVLLPALAAAADAFAAALKRGSPHRG